MHQPVSVFVKQKCVGHLLASLGSRRLKISVPGFLMVKIFASIECEHVDAGKRVFTACERHVSC